ncbi:hypothetical protein AC579_3366 [Pseudocercospora musae]|uniref:Uncharacterized protein n=1 Tax=Pseudocercospora musae TaxID=113226 RepID=A0A139GTI9_9PEZI|nr:hypothetical protein AC579_3366 [Pseudocercospora musae]
MRLFSTFFSVNLHAIHLIQSEDANIPIHMHAGRVSSPGPEHRVRAWLVFYKARAKERYRLNAFLPSNFLDTSSTLRAALAPDKTDKHTHSRPSRQAGSSKISIITPVFSTPHHKVQLHSMAIIARSKSKWYIHESYGDRGQES